jgi:nitrogen fixation-related uncharacterized protein
MLTIVSYYGSAMVRGMNLGFLDLAILHSHRRSGALTHLPWESLNLETYLLAVKYKLFDDLIQAAGRILRDLLLGSYNKVIAIIISKKSSFPADEFLQFFRKTFGFRCSNIKGV